MFHWPGNSTNACGVVHGRGQYFFRDLLASQKASASGQVSDNDSSINDSDCEALIASLDDEDNSDNQVIGKKSSKKWDPTVSNPTDISQQAINMRILTKLQGLGKRLDAMEQKSCKNGTDTSKIKNKSAKAKVMTQPMVTQTPGHPYISMIYKV